MKLLNDVFVFDEVWQESVKAFTISLFLSDLSSGFFCSSEELAGVNVVNFEQHTFFENSKSEKLQAREHLMSVFVQSMHVLKYFKAITSFFSQITEIYFPNHTTKIKKTAEQEGLNNYNNVIPVP